MGEVKLCQKWLNQLRTLRTKPAVAHRVRAACWAARGWSAETPSTCPPLDTAIIGSLGGHTRTFQNLSAPWRNVSCSISCPSVPLPVLVEYCNDSWDGHRLRLSYSHSPSAGTSVCGRFGSPRQSRFKIPARSRARLSCFDQGLGPIRA